ncbi:hypothetical protein V1478_012136 [Vespula squamosa]|uniref:Uncharacterized protein n=1 Tax=Vespula squamosa TaxID=30214 RepID=A0ABD2ACK0_VESSQ
MVETITKNQKALPAYRDSPYFTEMGLVEREANMQDLNVSRPGRSRDLFGVQLEVTSLLLEAERRKLAVLQRELQVALAEGGSVKVKEKQRQELLHAISYQEICSKKEIFLGFTTKNKRRYFVLQQCCLHNSSYMLSVFCEFFADGGTTWAVSRKIQGQHEQLDKEYRIHAAGVLRCNSRGSGKATSLRCISGVQLQTSPLRPGSGTLFRRAGRYNISILAFSPNEFRIFSLYF